MSFEIKLPLFQGPFDLLLFFIERDELDVYDIPIAKITQDFLEYLHHLESLNLEVASEFILVAATLMRIKAKMLLPRKELDEQGNEIDPRDELVKHLIEYKKYKAAAQLMAEMEDSRLNLVSRGNVLREIQLIQKTTGTEEALEKIDLYKLLRTYTKVMERFEIRDKKPTHTVVQYPYTIEDKKDYILSRVAHGEDVPFTELIADEKTRIAAVFNFLAILELVQLEYLMLRVGEGFNNFWISKREKTTA